MFLVGQKPNCESGIWCSARAQSINKCPEMGEMSVRLIAVISLYTFGLRVSRVQPSHLPSLFLIVFSSACSRWCIVVAAQQKVGCVVFSI